MNDTILDLRPELARSRAWVTELIAGVRPEQWDDPTPCADWTVRDLVAHLLAVEGRSEGQPRGSVSDLPSALPVPEADPAGEYQRAGMAAERAWADDATLELIVERPYGRVPGWVAVSDFTREHVVHGWDLATATGQPSDALDDLAERLLSGVERFLPADMRGPDIPFYAVIEPAADAGATERLVNWFGRRSRG